MTPYKKPERKPISFYVACEHGNPIATCPICNPPPPPVVIEEPDIEPPPTISPPPPEPTESRSVLGELLEGFEEISYAFNGIANSFNKFGNIIETEADKLGTQIKASIDNIKIDISNVISKFGAIGTNLAAIFETT